VNREKRKRGKPGKPQLALCARNSSRKYNQYRLFALEARTTAAQIDSQAVNLKQRCLSIFAPRRQGGSLKIVEFYDDF
jgi:hypothetical protein